MAIMDKLKFWKKEEITDPFSEPGPNMDDPFKDNNLANKENFGNSDPFANNSFQSNQTTQATNPFSQAETMPKSPEVFRQNQNMPQQSPFPTADPLRQVPSSPQFQPPQSPAIEQKKDNEELILSKLDTLKAMMENIGHRISLLEERQKQKEW